MAARIQTFLHLLQGSSFNRRPGPGHFSPQELMPDAAIDEKFYDPDDAEAKLRERLEEIRRARGRD